MGLFLIQLVCCLNLKWGIEFISDVVEQKHKILAHVAFMLVAPQVAQAWVTIYKTSKLFENGQKERKERCLHSRCVLCVVDVSGTFQGMRPKFINRLADLPGVGWADKGRDCHLPTLTRYTVLVCFCFLLSAPSICQCSVNVFSLLTPVPKFGHGAR